MSVDPLGAHADRGAPAQTGRSKPFASNLVANWPFASEPNRNEHAINVLDKLMIAESIRKSGDDKRSISFIFASLTAPVKLGFRVESIWLSIYFNCGL
ncbi:MAG: hypothetical protein V4727_04165 [Verrucomicrobiota bacterium]